MTPWINRIIVIVLDGAGVGALPDADAYGDSAANTLGHLARAADLHIPGLESLGLGNIVTMPGVPPSPAPAAAFGRLAERSAGKDSTIGHWELMGLVSPAPFPTYPDGFPEDIVRGFIARTGRGVLGNRPASGTAIIEALYDRHARTGKWIIYTSADSVLQVAAHEDVIRTEELYEACRMAAEDLLPGGRVLRVIARPFTGEKGSLRRTPGRRDYNAPPPAETALDILAAAQLPVVTIGKIDGMFAGRSITEAIHTTGNAETLDALRGEMLFAQPGLVFANLVDFDMLYGHRNDVVGYAAALEEFDRALIELLCALRARDVLIITADHGCDPTTPGTDHTREYVPVLVCGNHVKAGVDLGTRESFADAGATICAAFGLMPPPAGRSFWPSVAVRNSSGAERAERERMDWLRRRRFLGGSPA